MCVCVFQEDQDNEATGVVRRDPVPHCTAGFHGGFHGSRAVLSPRRTRRDQHNVAPGSLQSVGQQLLLGMCSTLLVVGYPLAAASCRSGPRASHTLRLQTSISGTVQGTITPGLVQAG